jgi:hypothetical protein
MKLNNDVKRIFNSIIKLRKINSYGEHDIAGLTNPIV